MRARRFGRTGHEVSELGVGMWGVADWSGTDEDEARAALQLSVDRGCTFYDTAWAYGEGSSERILGDLVRTNPERRLLPATKVPPKNRRWPTQRGDRLEDVFPPEYIREYALCSRENLGVDTIGLLQFHVWEDDWAEDTSWQDAVTALREEGVIAAVGVSVNRWEPWNVLRTLDTGLLDSVQVIYNIFDEGSLTGVLTADTRWPEGDWRNTYFVPENLVPEGMSLAELALRFVLSCPDVATVIPGMRRIANVEANVAAAGAGPLAPELLEVLRAHRWDRTPTAWSQ